MDNLAGVSVCGFWKEIKYYPLGRYAVLERKHLCRNKRRRYVLALSCYEKFLNAAFQTAGLSKLGVASPLAAAILPGFVILTAMREIWEISVRSIVDLRKAWWRVPACIFSVTGSALACACLLFAVVK